MTSSVVFKNDKVYWWAWLLAAVPAAIYFFIVNKYAVDQPYGDDYDAILQFLTKYQKTEGSWNRIILLFSQHNEHRILPSRIVYVLYYKLTGTVNFRHLILIANLQVVVIFLIFWQLLKRFGQQNLPVLLIFTSLILFDLNAYENANWAMAGMQNYGVVMFFLLGIFFYNKPEHYALPLAMLGQFFCAFSSGNGMIGGLVLVLFNACKRSRVKTIFSGVLFIACTALYFVDFYSPKVGHGAPVNKIIPFFLHSIGANFGFKMGLAGAFILLTGLAVFFPFQKKWRLSPNALPLLAIMAFIFASLGITAFFRAGISMEVSYSTRYFIYPHMFVCIVFVFLLSGLRNEKWKRVAVTACFLVFIAIYTVSYRYGTAGFVRIRQCIYDSGCYTDGSVPLKTKIAREACEAGIFCTDLPAQPVYRP